MLVIVLLIGIESHGAVRWISLFGTQLQISEILKPLLALSFAGYLSRKSEPSVFIFFSAIIFLVPVVILLYKQPDLGNAVIYATVAFFVLIVTGFPLRWFGAVLLPVLISLPVIWNFLHEYQRQRIITFIHPTVDPLGASYNGIQAVIAVGSGSYLGKGFFEGTQAALMFLPERHTDFIFATLSEDLGFIGAFLLIALFLFLCYRIYIVCMDSDSQFGKIFAATCFAFLFIQFVVNVGMNIGIIPIVGVTLPFVSYGGSSLLSNFIFLGLLVSLRRCAKAKEVLEIR
jgi:rod shape determining protein RodA